jgi:hypothetical protein
VRRLYGDVGTQLERIRVTPTATCMICGRTAAEVVQNSTHYKTPKPLGIDHDHATDIVRGVLCRDCNLALSYLRDDPALLRAALAYLRGNPARRIKRWLAAHA